MVLRRFYSLCRALPGLYIRGSGGKTDRFVMMQMKSQAAVHWQLWLHEQLLGSCQPCKPSQQRLPSASLASPPYSSPPWTTSHNPLTKPLLTGQAMLLTPRLCLQSKATLHLFSNGVQSSSAWLR